MIERIRTVAGLYSVNSDLVNLAFQGITSEEALERPSDLANSMLWILGHLTTARYGLCHYLGGRHPGPFGELFKRGADVDQSTEFPTLQEIFVEWECATAELERLLKKVTETRLNLPIDRDFPGVEKTVWGAVSFLNYHEAYHIGQLAYIRRLLGHSQLVG